MDRSPKVIEAGGGVTHFGRAIDLAKYQNRAAIHCFGSLGGNRRRPSKAEREGLSSLPSPFLANPDQRVIVAFSKTVLSARNQSRDWGMKMNDITSKGIEAQQEGDALPVAKPKWEKPEITDFKSITVARGLSGLPGDGLSNQT
ncbi:MAG: hypothetical protein ACTHJR_17675 [Sphingomonas sp.]|uniref:hypothetical protein n=1 Tax=Sphingomonas sp. TaxID=28214 RepID=UPI003F81B25C